MRKRLILFAILAALLACSACSKDIRINVPQADSVTVFYGLSSYALFSTDGELIKELASSLDGLRLMQTDKEMDVATTFNVCLAKGDTSLLTVAVDENGVIRVDGGDQLFSSSSGVSLFEKVHQIYESDRTNSQQAGGGQE